MTYLESLFCDNILRYGQIIKDVQYSIRGNLYRRYSIKCDGNVYELTKRNGEWIYINRCL